MVEGQERAKARRVGGGGGGGGGEPPSLFDVIGQHRWYCPWIACGVEEKGQPGWKQATKALVGRLRQIVVWQEEEAEGEGEETVGGSPSSSYAYNQNRKPEEVWKEAKRLLDGMS